MILHDFLTRGFTYTFDHELVKHILAKDLHDPDSWIETDDGIAVPPEYDLTDSMLYIKNKYVSPIFGESKNGYNSIWNKNESTVQVWHNDLREGPNLFFLYYMTNVYKGGEIRFRVNGIETGCVQPRVGLLVMGSQESHIEHKAEPTNEARVLSNYGFYVNIPRAV